jgi:2-polyprenyl-3-methyl-5-hydroxy-6-metoxy-1,4-benzoquinol methylase
MSGKPEYQPLLPLMRRFAAKVDAEAFYWAVNSAYHAAEAAHYDQYHLDMFQGLGFVWERLFGQLPPTPQRLSVLDIGCGTGLVPEMLNRYCAGRIGSYTGLDPSEAMLAMCQSKSGQWAFQTQLRKGLIDDLEPDARFDVVTICSVLHHVVELPAFCRRAAALLAPGGALLTAQDPRGEAADDLLLAERERQARPQPTGLTKLRRRLRQTVARPLRPLINRLRPHPLAPPVNKDLLARGVIGRPMDIGSIWAVTDFHVPGLAGGIGQGITRAALESWMSPPLRLIAYHTYQFLGDPWDVLNPAQQVEERRLFDAGDPHGRLFATAWRHRVDC